MLIHKTAEVQSQQVGEGTKIWQYSVVLGGAKIGKNCNINAHCFIENDVVIGDNVTIKCGVFLWDGITVEDSVFIGPNATFTNDSFPRSKQYPKKFSRITVCQGASIGANATILPGIRIGERAMVGAGSVVTHDIPAGCVAVGNPAKIIRTERLKNLSTKIEEIREYPARLIQLPKIEDERGTLSFVETHNHIPFEIKRIFYLYNPGDKMKRGEHAHRELLQFVLAISGKFVITIDNGKNTEALTLSSQNIGVLVPPLNWIELYNFSSDAVCLVLASEYYDESDYIRDYDEFRKLVGEL